MELKMYTPVSPKFVFEKIKFKVLRYIQHDFIRQRPGFSKDQNSIFKNLVINYFILNVKGNKYFFIREGAANVLLKLNYSTTPLSRTPLGPKKSV